MALLSESEPSRRWAAARFVDDCGVLLLWFFPLVLDLIVEDELGKEITVGLVLLGGEAAAA